MVKIKDRILLGALSGILASFPARIINRLSHAKKLTDIRYNPLAARLFLDEKEIKTTPGVLTGAIVNNINTATTGVAITYLISATGRDNAILKGMGISAFLWILVDGALSSHLLKIKSKKPIGPITHLAEHLFYGAVCATLITKLGDDSLFPPKEKDYAERTPLVYTGIRANADRIAPAEHIRSANQWGVVK